VVSTTHWLLYPQDRDPVAILQEAGWALGLVWTGLENSPTLGFEPCTILPVVCRYTNYTISFASVSVPHTFSLNYWSSISNFLSLELKLNAVIFGPHKCKLVQQKYFFITKLLEQLVTMQLWCGTFITQYSYCLNIWHKELIHLTWYKVEIQEIHVVFKGLLILILLCAFIHIVNRLKSLKFLPNMNT
jgi:hypothetical protein